MFMNDFADSFCLLDELSSLEKQYSNYVICFSDFEIIKKKLHAIIDKHNFKHCHFISKSDITISLYPSSIKFSYSAYVHYLIENNQ